LRHRIGDSCERTNVQSVHVLTGIAKSG